MVIKPSSELRNNYRQISELVNSGETVFLTKNGTGDMVLMSQALYDRMTSMMQLYSDLAISERQLRNEDLLEDCAVTASINKLIGR